jgi:hypothetical protein
MPKITSFGQLGKGGINTDIMPCDLPAEYITNGYNFRVVNGAIKTNGGSLRWYSDGAITDVGFLLPLGDRHNDLWVICTLDGIWAFDGITHYNIYDLSATPLVDIKGWSGCMCGGIPILNHPEIGCFYWVPSVMPLNTAQFLPYNASTDWEASNQRFGRVVRAHRNYLFMLNMNEPIATTTNIPDAYRWSHPADINSIPPSWDDTDPLFLAGLAQLGGETGRIIDGLSLRDSFIIYSDNAINILELSGDDFVWNRRQLTTTSGLLARECVVEVQGLHYYISNGDIMVFDGNKPISIMESRIRTHLQANLSMQNYANSFAISNLNYKEIWFCVPTGSSEYANLAYIYNWEANTWAIRQLPLTLTYATFGSKSQGPITWESFYELSDFQEWSETSGDWDAHPETWQSIENSATWPTWEDYELPWGATTFSPFDDTIIGSLESGDIRDLDVTNYGYFSGNDINPNTLLERTDLPLEGLEVATTITTVYPKITGSSPVQITFGSQDYKGAPVRWKTSGIFNPQTQRKLEVRTTGTLHAWRIESIGTGQFTIAGMDVEYTINGLR